MTTTDPFRIPIKLLLNAIDRQEWMVMEALLHPQTEFEVSHFIPFRGRDSVLNYFRNLRSMRKSDHLIEGVAIEGNHGICWGRFNAASQDGTEISVLFADVMQFEQNKIRKRRVYYCEPKVGT